MRRIAAPRFCVALAVLGLAAAQARAAKPAAPEPPALTPRGQELESQYAAQLKALRAEIGAALPALDARQVAAFLKAYQDEAVATAAELKALRESGGKPKDKEAAAAAYAAAKAARAQATTNALAPSKAMLQSLQALLAGDALDAKLACGVVLTEATPRGLAAYAQQGKAQEALGAQLLADPALMQAMLAAGGASEGQYGRAMEIYTAIGKASPRAGEGLFQRLALGVSLEHAVPVTQTNPQTATNAPTVVDPVQRYLHFEKAFLAGELDPGFKDLTAWDYRMVVDGDEPDGILTWGREMLRNYRPDHISTPDTRWRYVKAVKTDVKYGSADQKYDLPTLHPYQNMINTGGVCGRRAFFGRFILRAFGVPTVARPQRGHAALGHWTPHGWVINLGAGWEWGWTKKYGEGLDFVALTQARADAEGFLEALRAQWIGALLGEPPTTGFHAPPSGFWNGVALYRRRATIEAAEAVTLAAVGQDIAEANVSKEADVVETVAVTEADRKVVVGPDGSITVPAAACTTPATNTETIVFMKSARGGLQVHYGRLGKSETIAYTVDAPAAGQYALRAEVVTVSPDQNLLVTANDGAETVSLALPYTVGMWKTSEPVEVTLVKGPNLLRFSRPDPRKGVSVKALTLKPL